MRNQKVTDLVYLSLFLTIIVIMGVVPWLGFLPLGFASVTIIHIPVLIAIFYFGTKMGTFTGLIFGLVSWILAMIRPTQPLDPFFVNPVISVLPRVAFAFLAGVIYNALRNVLKNDYLVMTITAVIGTLIHSILVLGTLVVLEFPSITANGSIGAAAILALITLGTVSTLEAAAAGIISPIIVRALRTMNERDNIPVESMNEE